MTFTSIHLFFYCIFAQFYIMRRLVNAVDIGHACTHKHTHTEPRTVCTQHVRWCASRPLPQKCLADRKRLFNDRMNCLLRECGLVFRQERGWLGGGGVAGGYLYSVPSADGHHTCCLFCVNNRTRSCAMRPSVNRPKLILHGQCPGPRSRPRLHSIVYISNNNNNNRVKSSLFICAHLVVVFAGRCLSIQFYIFSSSSSEWEKTVCN